MVGMSRYRRGEKAISYAVNSSLIALNRLVNCLELRLFCELSSIVVNIVCHTDRRAEQRQS